METGGGERITNDNVSRDQMASESADLMDENWIGTKQKHNLASGQISEF